MEKTGEGRNGISEGGERDEDIARYLVDGTVSR